MKFRLSQKVKDQLWWLMISVDYDYSRVTIAEHELTKDGLSLWLEDKNDFKNTVDECLKLDISLTDFAKVIKADNLNSYKGSKMHASKNFLYKARIEIAPPIQWYSDDATLYEQKCAREAALRAILSQLIETENFTD